ncbi:MAG: DUF167 domain-containing protein [Alphaproteobacteria bacterium]
MRAYCHVQEGSVIVSVRVTPNARHNKIDGVWNENHLKIALHAPAVDGKANEALIAFLSALCGIRKADVTLLSGQTSRCKRVRLTGNTDDIVSRLEAF